MEKQTCEILGWSPEKMLHKNYDKKGGEIYGLHLENVLSLRNTKLYLREKCLYGYRR